ncbi:MAG: hypothetical protein V1722_04665 [Candidatus Micrarchaeota archaeon]
MAKVVLVWNEHPTEVVAGYHARKVADILRKKYGHEVMVEKVPFKKTNTGIVAHNSPAKAVNALRVLTSSRGVTAQFSKKHAAPAFNFHTSSQKSFEQSEKRKPENFRVGNSNIEIEPILSFSPFSSEIIFQHGSNPLQHEIEIPAFYERLPKTSYGRRREKLIHSKTLAHLEGIAYTGALRDVYHLERTPLSHSKQKKYLSPIISEKIAAAIHERLTAAPKHK